MTTTKITKILAVLFVFIFALANEAAARAINAKLNIPQHYGDLPNFAKDASVFAAELKKYNLPFYEMKPGETMTFRGAKSEKK